MAPPKRKTGGGRVTPKGTRPEDRHTAATSNERHAGLHIGHHSAEDGEHHAATASSRYTPKAQPRQIVPPNWIPVIMLVLLIGGGLAIMARYLIFTDSNIPTLVGLVMILGGLYTATKWR
jgi:hypothetical protein